jgi:hypothetical protein
MQVDWPYEPTLLLLYLAPFRAPQLCIV